MQCASIISSESFWKIYLHRWINLEFLWSSLKVVRITLDYLAFIYSVKMSSKKQIRLVNSVVESNQPKKEKKLGEHLIDRRSRGACPPKPQIFSAREQLLEKLGNSQFSTQNYTVNNEANRKKTITREEAPSLGSESILVDKDKNEAWHFAHWSSPRVYILLVAHVAKKLNWKAKERCILKIVKIVQISCFAEFMTSKVEF